MARSMAAALEAVEENPEFDRRVRLVVEQPTATPTPEAIEAAFRRYDYHRELASVRRTVRHKWNGVSAEECEDAVSEALALLLYRKPYLFEGPPIWMGLLVKASCDLLAEWIVQRKRFRIQSIEGMYTETGPGDNAFGDARLLGSGRPVPQKHREATGPIATARLCAAFFRREGHWPNTNFFRFARDFDLPTEGAAKTYLGGATARKVQLGVEAILTPEEIRKARI